MNENYFSIMDESNLERTHSAMLRFLLFKSNFFVTHIFTAFKSDIEHIELEKKYGSYAIDIEASSPDRKNILIIENKFKSVPTKIQLEKYDEEFKKLDTSKPKQGKGENIPNIIKYLLVFSENAVPFPVNNGLIDTGKGDSPWRLITWDTIKDKLKEFIDTECLNESTSVQTFCQHYYEYIQEYYKIWEEVVNPHVKIPHFG
jgi:hypothetical protein